MVEWNGFDYGFDYDYDYSFDYGFGFVYDYSFDFDFDYAYGNRKGLHKQSLIVKCFVTFKTLKIFEF